MKHVNLIKSIWWLDKLKSLKWELLWFKPTSQLQFLGISGEVVSPKWAWTKRSSNWEGRILFLTRRPYALLRFPHFCLRWTPVFGYAYAVLTLSLWMTFCAQTRSGSLRTRLFCLQQDSARRFGQKRWRRGALASSFQSEVLPSAFCDMDNILWKHHEWIPRLLAFVALPIAVMVSLWAALWANEWASGQRDSWALRIPYAFLTQITDHTLDKNWENWRNYSNKRCIWLGQPDGKSATAICICEPEPPSICNGRNEKQSQIENTVSN